MTAPALYLALELS
jgi:transposase